MSSAVKTVFKFWMFESKYHHSSVSTYCNSSSSRFSIVLYQCSLSVFMFSYNQASRKGGLQDGRIVKSGHHVMVAYDVISDKYYVLRGAAAMVVDFSNPVLYPRTSMNSRWMIRCVSVVLRKLFRLDD